MAINARWRGPSSTAEAAAAAAACTCKTHYALSGKEKGEFQIQAGASKFQIKHAHYWRPSAHMIYDAMQSIIGASS